MSVVRTFLMLCVVSSLSGCSGGLTTYPVSGTVTAEGNPLAVGEIVFTSDKYTDRCPLDSKGDFAVKLPDGDFKVFFLGTTQQEYGSTAPPKYSIPKKYTDLATTDLTQSVDGPTTAVMIDLHAK
ncbi:MAG: hypothetical protein JWN70_6831 [Planctomycetaceae bacterium]|nr:hypothetical protein [Planctomycetaceae bacterium]